MTNGQVTYEQVLSVLDNSYRSAAELAVMLKTDDVAGVRTRCDELVAMKRVRKTKAVGRIPEKYRVGW